MSSLIIKAEGFTPPGPADFELPAIAFGVTKPMLQLVLAAVIVFVFFYVAARHRQVVPGRLQFAGEQGYNFVRNSMSRDILGTHDFMKFTPYLFALFFFILVNNVFATIPFFQFPTFSRSGMVYGLAAMSWIIYNAVGIKKHGFLGYLKLQSVPSGVTGPILALLIPLEFLSNIIVRPVTLALRLFANMLAGHLLLILFALGGEYLIVELGGAYAAVGILSWVMFIAIAFLELLVQFLQAYVFVLLNAMYIQGALADEH
ncbi:F0F1 ATP synthase subunit A [Nocardioides bruguierae]|uniref:F0F1 ATP synthase subunit A n=1 Tax=Nocardioides bruguierae TaxID=2945102 RepID=UPI002021B390|nr:F0F1 ATP synthase subunit A [Nocardioides bruguierae]MCL8024782.1 F0F1 ATP synthase subunit A [Nocardioides bruguierae]